MPPDCGLESGRFSGQSGLRIRPSGKRPVAFDPERTSRCFGLGADIKNFAPELRSNNSSGLRAAPCVGGLRRRINALPR